MRGVLLFAALLVGLGGCEDKDRVRRIEVPPIAESEFLPSGGAAPSPAQDRGETGHDHGPPRIIVAIMEHAGRPWFFKMRGPAADMHPEIEHFVALLHSVEFTEGGPEFEAPGHWERLEATGMRHAAFRFGHAGHPVEFTVVGLGPEAGALLPNVNRWRGQLGLGPIDESELERVVRRFELGGRELVIVELVGGPPSGGRVGGPPSGGRVGGPPSGGQVGGPPSGGQVGGPPSQRQAGDRPAGPRAQDRPEDSQGAEPGENAAENPGTGSGQGGITPLRYEVPPGWREQEASGMRRASLAVMEGGEVAADVSVIPLAGGAGGMRMNVNRWRGQVGLEPVEAAALKAMRVAVPIDGGKMADHFDFEGRDEGGSARRILVVVHERGGRTWFIKMDGRAEVVGREREAFLRFVRSIRFGGPQS